MDNLLTILRSKVLFAADGPFLCFYLKLWIYLISYYYLTSPLKTGDQFSYSYLTIGKMLVSKSSTVGTTPA